MDHGKAPTITSEQNPGLLREGKPGRAWGLTSLIPALGRWRQMDLCAFEASLVYRIVRQRNPVSKEREELGGGRVANPPGNWNDRILTLMRSITKKCLITPPTKAVHCEMY